MNIHTDGSCLGNPGPGGWAAHCDLFTIYDGGGSKTTNNAMELTAVIKALEKLKVMQYETDQPICIVTDSSYVKNGITSWVAKWVQNSWKTSTGQPVKNKELWEKLYTLSKQFSKLTWKWVKAHNGDPNNEKVDSLARKCAEGIKDKVSEPDKLKEIHQKLIELQGLINNYIS
jgi:ribonuclease HI